MAASTFQRSAALLLQLSLQGLLWGLPACGAVDSCTAEKEAGRGAEPAGSEHLMLQIGKTAEMAEVGSLGRASSLVDSSGGRCDGLEEDVHKRCGREGCKNLITNMKGRSCGQYCEQMGFACAGAWDEWRNSCFTRRRYSCEYVSTSTSDLICECTPGEQEPEQPAPSPVPLPSGGGDHELGDDPVAMSTFFWNVHWECSMAARGASASCKHRVGQRFVELARQSDAEVVASVELSDSMSQPASLIHFGLHGWTQVDGPCARGVHQGDAAALAFAPSWRVEKSGGGCLRTDWDTRAFAVALAVPPRPVRGCPKLCVLSVHAPHSSINNGREEVESVCGDYRLRCSVAMGDWNIPAKGVKTLWSKLIGGEEPSEAQPDQRTCCWPEARHYGVFDHLATNVRGAVHESYTVHPYQLLEENPRKQHRAVSLRLMLPGV